MSIRAVRAKRITDAWAEAGFRSTVVSTEEFVRVMVTNALSPMRVVEAFQDLVPPTALRTLLNVD